MTTTRSLAVQGTTEIEGGDGPDAIEGGPGDDIITDLSGFDVIEGGSGNDAIFSGNEEDVIFGDEGNDFIVNPSEFGEIFAGLGDDYIFDGDHLGHIRGGAGADWMENTGGGEDLWQGDNGAAPEAGEPEIKGHDVFIAHGGNNDADMENGDDIVVDGPGIERTEGQLGFDWQSFQNDKFGVNIDLDLTIFLRPVIPPSNASIQNRYDRVEGVSGSPFGDILRGTANPLGTNNGNELVNFDLIEGLNDSAPGANDGLVPLNERRDLDPDPTTGELQFGWTGGELMLGGAGSDLLVGEGGDDIIDGDAMLTVGILTPDPAVRMGLPGQALRTAQALATSTASQAVADRAAADAFVEAGAQAATAVAAAEAAATAAIAAAEAADLAVTGGITVTADLGTFVATASNAAWDTFFATCSALLNDLNLQVQATTAETAAQAVAAQAAAIEAQIAAEQLNLEATAVASAMAANAAQAALVVAQGNTDPDQLIVVPGMRDLMDAIFEGYINPGELSISRVIADEDPGNTATDIAMFSGNQGDYTINLTPTAVGFIEVTDNRVPVGGGGGVNLNATDGRDLLRNVERLQFADGVFLVPSGTAGASAVPNSPAVGQPTIAGTPAVGNTLMASIAGVSDADNVPPSPITSPIDWLWQVELAPGTGVFTPIQRDLNGNGDLFGASGDTLVVTNAEAGLLIRVVATFQDDAGVFEMVTSAPVTGGGAAAASVNRILTLGINGNGSATLAPAGGYELGTVVPLVAIPHFGSTLGTPVWTGNPDCTDGVVTITTDIFCAANVTLNQFTLTVNQTGTGTTSPAGVSVHDFGTVVPLQATAGGGDVFTGWSGDVDCGDHSVTMTADRTCTANFAAPVDTGTLEVIRAGTGSGSVTSLPEIDCPVDCQQTYLVGASVSLIATTDAGSTFGGFSGACNAAGTVTIAAGLQTCTATFNGGANTAPVVTITSPANGSVSTTGDSVSFSGTAIDAEDGDISASLDWVSSLDGSIATDTAAFATTTLSIGTHVITASTVDSGALPGADSISITVIAAPNTPPAVTIVTPADGSSSTDGDSVSFSGTAIDAEDGDISASLDWTSSLDGTIATDAAAFATTTLSVGTHVITASTTDSGALLGADSIIITVNAVVNTPPVVTITAPADGSSSTDGDLVSFTGTAIDAEDGDISATLDWSSDLDGVLATDTASFATAALSVGTHVITASTTDSGALPGADSITITVNAVVNTPPVVTILTPADGSSSTDGDLVSFTGTAIDAEDGDISATLDWSSDVDGVLATNTASFATAALSVGTHVLTASTTDSGGLPGADSITITVNAVVVCTGNTICGFELHEAGQPVGSSFIRVLNDGDTVSLSAECNGSAFGCNIEAMVASPEGATDAVRLSLAGVVPPNANRRERAFPYFLGGDTAGTVDVLPAGQPYIGAGLTASAAPGTSHTVHATPYADANAQEGGAGEGSPASVTFFVIP